MSVIDRVPQLVEKTFPILVNSLNGQEKSADGSTFTYRMSPPLTVPREALDCSLTAIEANTVYSYPNLSVNSTDVFEYRYNGVDYSHNIPQGIYSLAELQSFMNRCALSDGISLTEDLFVLEGIEATQRVAFGCYIASPTGQVAVYLGVAGAANLAALLGFDAVTLLFPATTPGAYYFNMAPNRARFSDLQFVSIETDLLTSGYSDSGSSNRSIAVISPDVGVGESILYRPRHPLVLNANELIGKTIYSITFTLKDNLGNTVNTMGESWSVRILITYHIPRRVSLPK